MAGAIEGLHVLTPSMERVQKLISAERGREREREGEGKEREEEEREEEEERRKKQPAGLAAPAPEGLPLKAPPGGAVAT